MTNTFQIYTILIMSPLPSYDYTYNYIGITTYLQFICDGFKCYQLVNTKF